MGRAAASQLLLSALTVCAAVACAASAVGRAPAAAVTAPHAPAAADILSSNQWKNDLILGSLLPPNLRAWLPHEAQIWLRNYICCIAVYVFPGTLWAAAVMLRGRRLLGPRGVVARAALRQQLLTSFLAMPLYSAVPAVTEVAAEWGMTRAYGRISDVGLVMYLVHLITYMLLVEYGVYWVHRLLHEIKWLYRHVHSVHHAYNKEHTISPFAGFAFHPLDGVLQAAPYALLMFIVPMHFLTHELLLFATALWTASIHDNVHRGMTAVMGAAFHTIHHKTYRHNYGQYLVLCDWLHGTLVSPEEYQQMQQQRRQQQQQDGEEGEEKASAQQQEQQPRQSQQQQLLQRRQRQQQQAEGHWLLGSSSVSDRSGGGGSGGRSCG